MDVILDLERRYWLEGADFYREHLSEDFLMVFPGLGTMRRSEAIEGIERGARWSQVEIRNPSALELAPGVRLLSYEARAQRSDEQYSALASSVYVKTGALWKLAFHQQSPTG